MAVYERLSGDKKWPPESRKARRQLQFGRYDYYVEEEQPSDQQQQKHSGADVAAIVQRLRQEIRPSNGDQPPRQQHVHRTVSKAEAAAIFDRLRSCDHARWPVESRLGRRQLGQSRYDYGAGGGEASTTSTPRATKAELDAIVGRLSAYDVAKTPPNSRALEIKQQAKGGGQ